MMLTCALSGVIPEEAVISRKTGHIYERRLIEKHLKQTNTCPITNQDMTVEDLMPVANNGKVVRARPPTATSLPALLSLFASEWDSLMLETYNLKKQLESTRQELAHSLYQHDAACRVIARLIKERDQARAGLTATQSNAAAALNPPSVSSSMDVDSKEALGIASVEDRLVATASALTGDRKKRVKAAVASVASREALAKYTQNESHPLHSTSAPGINAVDVHSVKQDMIVTGGNDSNAIVFNRSTGKIVHTLKGHSKKITDVRFHPTNDRVVLTASHDNTAIVWKGDEDLKYTAQHTIRAHSGPLCGVSIHPSGDFFITGSTDKTWAFHDIETGITRQTISDDKQTAGYTRVQFHPDGLLLGAATEDALVRIYDIKAQKTVATFKGHSGKVHGLSFSENGYYLATGDDSGTVKIWDLRKLLNIQTFVVPDIHSIASLVFDASGSYLGVAGANVTVYGTKDWDVVATYREHKDIVTDLKFGRDARFIASVSKDRTLKFAA